MFLLPESNKRISIWSIFDASGMWRIKLDSYKVHGTPRWELYGPEGKIGTYYSRDFAIDHAIIAHEKFRKKSCF